MQSTMCKLCGANHWKEIAVLDFGIWNTDSSELKRDENQYPIGNCKTCNHVQLMNDYSSDLFQKLYFSSEQEAVFWHEALVNSTLPFEEMIDLCRDSISPHDRIVDFGCGPGVLLSIFANNFADYELELIGVDFNNRLKEDRIQYVHSNLNSLCEEKIIKLSEIDLAIASHTLEHIVDPVKFLKAIAAKISKKGAIFVEIPDFTDAEEIRRYAGQSNLVNMQHIHYFTEDSIRYLAHQAGLKIVKLKRLITGYIPRLQVLMHQGKEDKGPAPIQVNAVDAVQQCLEECDYKRLILKNKIEESIEQFGRVGLWGVGADCVKLLSDQKLHDLLVLGKIDLFDSQLNHHTLFDQKIHASKDMADYDFPIFMTPLLAETRIKMHRFSERWVFKVRDIYSN